MRAIRLKVSVSGVRGVVGETLTPQLICRFARAFGTYIGPGRVLVGRDTRRSGPMVARAVQAGLMSTGCEPVDAGVVPVPSLQLRCARRQDICGGVAITASHNPAEWNALKLLSGQGLFLSGLQANELLDIYNQGIFERVTGLAVPDAGYDEEVIEAHLDAVLAEVDVERIRKAGLRVAIDCVNGAGANATPRLLSRLGCSVEHLGCQPSGHFHRPPEPLPANLSALTSRVRNNGADVGFAQDADADRLAVVDHTGRALDGDQMLALLFDLVLQREAQRSRKAPVVVVNLSTSRLIDHVAARHGAKVLRTPVGEANVVAELKASGAVVGGEGSGGLIYPAIHACRDSFIGMALLLEHLAGGAPIAELVDRLPPRVLLRQKLKMPSTQARRLLRLLALQLEQEAEVDLRDGVKADWPQGWIHVRRSNTEPIVRVIVEADSDAEANALLQRVDEIINLSASA